MPIAPWEAEINKNYVAQGMNPYYTEDQASSPYEASGGDNSKYLQLLQQSGAIPANYGVAPATPSAGTPSMGAPASGGGYQQNPYLQQQADAIGQQSQFALGQAFNGIRGGALASGGFGGSRQGVAEGIATGLANQGLTGNLASLYGNDYQQQANRDLQNRGLDVTMRGQDIGWQNNTNQYGLQSKALDSQLETAGINNAWAPLINAGNVFSQFGGGSQTNSTNTGGGWGGAAGGLLGGATLAAQQKWW